MKLDLDISVVSQIELEVKKSNLHPTARFYVNVNVTKKN